MDARWYNPHSHRFQQPDYWNFRNTGLPSEIQHELVAHLQLNTNQLLNDPSQQMSYGYVSGNPLKWVDPWGLCMPVETDSTVSKEATIQVVEDNINAWVEAETERHAVDYAQHGKEFLRELSTRYGIAGGVIITATLGTAGGSLGALAVRIKSSKTYNSQTKN
jgi:hypothetical protein